MRDSSSAVLPAVQPPSLSDAARHRREPRSPGALALVLTLLTAAAACTSGTEPGENGNGGGDGSEGTISVAVSPTDLSIEAGEDGSVTVTLTRGGGFTGAVSLAAEGLPSGVTAAFAPASVPSGSAASTLTLTVAASSDPGTSTVTVRASGPGVSSATATLTLTVTVPPDPGGFTLSLAPATVSVEQGQVANATVHIERTGGFSGTVSLSASGVPAGLTVDIDPESTDGDEAALILAAAAGAAAGEHEITVAGSAAGLADQAATLDVDITEAPPSGEGLLWGFCENAPDWMAYQDDDGPWTELTVMPDSEIEIPISDRGGVAFVTLIGGHELLQVIYATRLELEAYADWCATFGGAKTVHGSVAGLGPTDGAYVGVGVGATFVSGGETTFTITNVPGGVRDLVSSRHTATGADRLIIRRGLEPADGETLPVLDFAGAEAFEPVERAVSIQNLNGETGQITVAYLTENRANTIYSTHPGSSATAHRYAGVPGSEQVAGDLHELIATATAASGTSTRAAYLFFRDATDRTATLGPAVATPMVSTAATQPYARARLRLAVQPEYDDQLTFVTRQVDGLSVVSNGVITTAGYLGGAPTEWDVEVPDLTGAGFDADWGIRPGIQTQWDVFVFGWPDDDANPLLEPVDGLVMLNAITTGTIVP